MNNLLGQNLTNNLNELDTLDTIFDLYTDYQNISIPLLKKYISDINIKIHEIKKIKEVSILDLENVTNRITSTENNFLNIKQEMEILLVNLENEKKEELKKEINKECKTIHELCTKINNNDQINILNRIVTDKEYSKIYLSGYEANTDTSAKKKDIIGTVKVFGTFNVKKQNREEYEIKIFKENPKGMFWCSCADHKFNSAKKNIVCKHICFLICKIAKVLKPDVFQNKKLSDEDLALLLAKLSSNEGVWQDQDIAKIFKKITLETFKQFVKAIEDCCPVCFNDLTEADKPELLACPSCKNYIHAECADIWMEQKNTCVLCKSKFWENYPKVKNGGSIASQ